MIKKYCLKIVCYFFMLLVITWISSCSSNKNKGKSIEDSIEIVDIDEQLITEISTAKQIFYSLPSPLETAMLIKKSGAAFNPEILNSIDNAKNYITSKSMALNLGIYSTDLSYASLFDQTQYSIQYMTAARKMVDGLGITDAITNETIEKLQENLNHRDVIMDIISEAFMNSSSFLKENDRSSISALVLVGGWIEGVYIATKLVNKSNFNENGLVDRIVDQKLSLVNVIKLLEENKEDEDVASVLILVKTLKNAFDAVEITTTPIVTEKQSGSDITTLKSTTNASINLTVFENISQKVEAIRNNFTL